MGMSCRSRSAAPVTRVLSRRCCCRDSQGSTTFAFNHIECSIVAVITRTIRASVVSLVTTRTNTCRRMRRITIRSVSHAISRRRRKLRPHDAVRRFVPLAPRAVRPVTCPRSSWRACTPNSPTTGSASPNPTNPSRGNVSAGVAFSPNVAEVRLRRRRNSAQGCFNPGSQDQRRLNAESVGQLLRSSYVVGDIFPGLKQPGAEFSERLRCYFTKGCEVLLTVSPINLDPVVAHFWDDANAVVAGEDDVSNTDRKGTRLNSSHG